jgi:DNA-binding transcriptional MerR regulator
MKVTAKATRSGQWWAVEVPEVDGAFTQARRLDQVPAMVADAVHLLTGVPVEEIEVLLGEVDLGDPQVLAEAREARERVAAAARSQEDAARASRRAVTRLRARGLSVRDVGVILNVSPQRVSQLAATSQ